LPPIISRGAARGAALPYQFPSDVRDDLHRLGYRDQVITELEQHAALYERNARSARVTRDHELPRATADLRRIHKGAAALLKVIDAAHPLVRLATKQQGPAIEMLARKRKQPGGKPVDHDRRDL
jgi:hypothetical protein